MDAPEPITIRPDDPTSPVAAALITQHLAIARGLMPAGLVYALDVSGLAAADTRFFTAWRGQALAGMGALRRLAPDHAEIKSMRTPPGHQRQGVAGAMLAHLLAIARADGVSRVSLETGTQPLFAPAIRLYEAAGFQPCDAYGDYRASPYNRFMTLAL